MTEREQVEAAKKRLEKGEYLPWTNAGGPNECHHGYAAGIPCRQCDEIAASKEKGELKINGAGNVWYVPKKHTDNCKCGDEIEEICGSYWRSIKDQTVSHVVNGSLEDHHPVEPVEPSQGITLPNECPTCRRAIRPNGQWLCVHEPKPAPLTFEQWWANTYENKMGSDMIELYFKGVSEKAWKAAKETK